MWKKFAFAVLFTTSLYAQKQPTEIGLISDNDLYTSSVYDRYYTNGLEFYYRYLGKNSNEKIAKKITEFKFGQYIYNPQTRNGDDVNRNDRPFAGYLFIEGGRNIFYQSESVLKTNLQLGYVGPNAYGAETQKIFHDIFGYKRVYGWQNQIKNALSVQLNMLYSKKVLSDLSSKDIDFQFQSEVNAGTIWDGISVGFLSRIALKKLLPVYDSNLHDAALNADPEMQKQTEFYFFINPNFTYQVYDATVQGSMFSENSPVTYDLVPFRFQGEAGFKYRKNHWNASYTFLYRGKEVDNRANENYFYGSIRLGYIIY